MTTKELREHLATCDDNAEVLLHFDGAPRGNVTALYKGIEDKKPILAISCEFMEEYAMKEIQPENIIWAMSGKDYDKTLYGDYE